MSAGGQPFRLRPAECTLLVVDVLEKLLPAIADSPRLLVNTAFLLDAARLLGVPAVATEQYPKGLGKTARSIAQRLPAAPPEKVAFSCCAVPDLLPPLRGEGRSVAVLCGIETHVCVLQTALDLLENGVDVAIAADAVAARFAVDHDLALRRAERAGALMTTAETVVFEWVATAASPQFKAVSNLVQQRARALQALAAPGVTNGT